MIDLSTMFHGVISKLYNIYTKEIQHDTYEEGDQ